MIITKAKPEQMKEVIDLLNRVYGEVAQCDFDIRVEQPKVYADPNNCHADKHFICIEDRKIVGVAGNVIEKFTFNHIQNSVSFVGSVAVDKDYRLRGIMTKLMEAIEKENIEQNVTFSLLTGRRSRFLHYGYEKGPFNYFYKIDTFLLEHQKINPKVTIRPMTQEDVHISYLKYLDFTSVKTRFEQDFFRCLKTWQSIPYVVFEDGKYAGYFSYLPRLKRINVMNVNASAIFSAFYQLFKQDSLTELNVVVSPLDKERNKILSRVADSVNVEQDISLKVYDWLRFFQIIFYYNSIEFDCDTDIVFEIDGTRYEIDIEYPHVGVWKTKRHKPDIVVSSVNMIPYLFSPLSHRNASFLPLFFAIPYPDLF